MKAHRHLKHYFIPNRRNGYRPHFLRAKMAGITAVAIVTLFVGATAFERFIIFTPGQFAAVIASSLVDLTNLDREGQGLSPLTTNPALRAAAQMKANDMAAKSYFAHDSPDGHDPWYWFDKAGYRFSHAGENLAVYFSDSGDVNSAWMNSPEHRANLLNPQFTEIGIATAIGEYKGYQTVFVVQEFGTPSRIAAAEAPQQTVATLSPAEPAQTVALGATPAVAGASAPVARKIIAKTNTYIAVKEEGTSSPHIAAPLTSTPAANSAAGFAGSPYKLLGYTYAILALIILVALLLDIGIEVKRHNPMHVARGVLLLLLMLGLLWGGHAYFFGTLMIA
jgi:uncharacterized protein YkwD